MRHDIRILFVVILSIFHAGLSGQTFAPLGTVWTYEVDDFWRPGYIKPYKLYVEEVKMFKGELSSFLSGSDILTDRVDGVYFYSQFTEQFELLYPSKASVGDTISIVGLSSQPPPMERCVLRVTNTYKDTLCDNRIIDVWDTEIIYDQNSGHTYWEIFGRISPQVGSLDHFMFPQPALAAPHISGLRCYEVDSFFCNFTNEDCDALVSSTKDINTLNVGVHYDHNRNITITHLPNNKEAIIQLISPDGIVIHDGVYPTNITEANIKVGQAGVLIIHIVIEGYEPHNLSIFLP